MVLLKKVCRSSLNLKIISFFHQNPQTVDTASHIAIWLNMDKKEVKKVLDYLVEKGILVSHRIGSTVAYAYTQNKTLVKEIEKFLLRK